MSFAIKEQVQYTILANKINFDNLTYHFKGSNTAPTGFVDFSGPMHIYNNMVIYQWKKIQKIENSLNQN